MKKHNDSRKIGWSVRHLAPYIALARLDRPIGWWLLLLPAWQALILGGVATDAATASIIWLGAVFWLGAVVMRGAGCVINDLWDRNLDRLVERTRNRPLATGTVSVGQALVFLLMLCLVGLAILLSLPDTAIIVGVMSLPLIIIYPLAKRYIGLPQLVLSLAFSWGAWLGWAAYGVWPGAESAVLYAASACWVFGYDTIYAIQDKADDAKAKIRSSALTLGGWVQPVVALCYAVMLALLLILGQVMAEGYALNFNLWAIGLGVLAVHLGWQVRQINPAKPDSAEKLFLSNRDAGLILTAAMVLACLG